jgi:hypothetical protein
VDTGRDGTRGFAHGIVGSARVIAFGASIVAPAVSVITVLVVMTAYAGFASPLMVVITFAGSLCCAISGFDSRHPLHDKIPGQRLTLAPGTRLVEAPETPARH